MAQLWCGAGGRFSHCKVGDLHQVKDKLNQTGYHSILLHPMIPSGMWFVGQEFVLKQGYDSKCTSRLCQRYMKNKEEQYFLQLMSFPMQSADLNPIELAWNELYWKVKAKQVISAAHLWQLLKKSPAELFSVYLQPFVKRRLTICEVVIVAKWGHFDKSKVLEVFYAFFICILHGLGRFVFSLINKTIVMLTCFIKNNTFGMRNKNVWGCPNIFDTYTYTHIYIYIYIYRI